MTKRPNPNISQKWSAKASTKNLVSIVFILGQHYKDNSRNGASFQKLILLPSKPHAFLFFPEILFIYLLIYLYSCDYLLMYIWASNLVPN